MIEDFTKIQLIQLRIIMIEFHVVLNLSKSFDSSKEFETQKPSDVNVNGGIDRFNSNNVGYFDSFYVNKSVDIVFIIKHIDKNIFFRDIYVFVNRVKNVTRVKNIFILRQNL